MICPLTAFVAWDEAEKVAVASQELVQPNLRVAGEARMLFCQMPGVVRAESLCGSMESGPRAQAAMEVSLARRGYTLATRAWFVRSVDWCQRLHTPALRKELDGAIQRIAWACNSSGEPGQKEELEKLVAWLVAAESELERLGTELDSTRLALSDAEREARSGLSAALSALDALRLELSATEADNARLGEIAQAFRQELGQTLARLGDLLKRFAELLSRRAELKSEIAHRMQSVGTTSKAPSAS